MNALPNQQTSALVDPNWVAAHANDPDVCLIDVAGLGQDDLQAYKAGHVPGAHPWKWKDMLWDTHMRDFPAPQEFARRLAGVAREQDRTQALQAGFAEYFDKPFHNETLVAALRRTVP